MLLSKLDFLIDEVSLMFEERGILVSTNALMNQALKILVADPDTTSMKLINTLLDSALEDAIDLRSGKYDEYLRD